MCELLFEQILLVLVEFESMAQRLLMSTNTNAIETKNSSKSEKWYENAQQISIDEESI